MTTYSPNTSPLNKPPSIEPGQLGKLNVGGRTLQVNMRTKAAAELLDSIASGKVTKPSTEHEPLIREILHNTATVEEFFLERRNANLTPDKLQNSMYAMLSPKELNRIGDYLAASTEALKIPLEDVKSFFQAGISLAEVNELRDRLSQDLPGVAKTIATTLSFMNDALVISERMRESHRIEFEQLPQLREELAYHEKEMTRWKKRKDDINPSRPITKEEQAAIASTSRVKELMRDFAALRVSDLEQQELQMQKFGTQVELFKQKPVVELLAQILVVDQITRKENEGYTVNGLRPVPGSRVLEEFLPVVVKLYNESKPGADFFRDLGKFMVYAQLLVQEEAAAESKKK
jgi:hypothetical protein